MVNIICSEWIPLENIRFKIGKFWFQKFWFQKVKPIRSEWIPLENIRFKIGIFIDWEVVRLPPSGGGCFLIVYVYDTIYGVDTLCYIYYCVNMIRLLRVLFVRYWTYIGVFIYVQFTVCARGFWNTKYETSKNGFVIETLTKRIFLPKNVVTDKFCGRRHRRVACIFRRFILGIWYITIKWRLTGKNEFLILAKFVTIRRIIKLIMNVI